MKSFIPSSRWLISRAPFIFCVLIATLYLLPFLLFPGFSVIDDGWTLHITHDLKEASLVEWPGILVEPAIGRLRPIYYLYFYALYLITGAHPFLFWVGQWLVLVATLIVIYHILFKITRNTSLSLIGVVAPFIFTATPENLYRLGTQEPRQFLFVISFFWWAMSLDKQSLPIKKVVIGLVLLVLALGTKETSLVLIPLFGAIYILKLLLGEWRTRWHLLLTVLITLIGVGFYALIPDAQSYSQEYSFSVSEIMHRASLVRMTEMHIFWLVGLVGCLAAVRLYFFSPTLQLKKLLAANFWQLILLLALLGSWAIILPWSLQLERYYYNVTLFTVMLIIVELGAWWNLRKQLKKYPSLQKWAIVVAVLVLFTGMTRVFFHQQIPQYRHMLRNTRDSMKGWFSGYQNNHIVIKYLMEKTPDDGVFYAAYSDYEVIYDMGQYASLFGDREIIIYNANPQLSKDFGYPYVFIEDPYAAYEADQRPKILVDKATNPNLDTLSTPHIDLIPRVSFYTAPKDLWSVTHSP